MSEQRRRGLAFARLLSSAVVSQGLLSAANFIIGLILIRNTSAEQYGLYILVYSAILLLISLQNAFIGPPLAIRITKLDQSGRSELVGGLYREQRRYLPSLGAIVVIITIVLWFLGVLDIDTGPLVLVTVLATLAILNREYFRMVLFAHRRPLNVLHTDILYVILTITGVYIASFTATPSVTAVTVLALAAIVSGIFLSRALHRFEPWDLKGAKGILREIAPLATWSTAGAAIHWTFSQGYIYLVASTLSITAVSIIAATRLLMMPMNLLSTGIRSVLFPLATRWLHQHGAGLVWRRLILIALGLAVMTLFYFAILWLLRDWIFEVVLKKQFAERDELLLLWGAIILVTVVRDQLIYLMGAQGRFKTLGLFTLFCAVLALLASYIGMLQFGVSGALIGMFIGEVVNLLGIIIFSMRSKQAVINEQVRSTA